MNNQLILALLKQYLLKNLSIAIEGEDMEGLSMTEQDEWTAKAEAYQDIINELARIEAEVVTGDR